MKLFREIFGRIWAVWACILFVTSMLLFMIPFLIIRRKQEPSMTRQFIAFSKVWMDIFLNGIGCHLTVKGKEHFEKGKNYIVVCNHNSLMDVPISCPYIPGGNKTIAKQEMAKTPVFGILYAMGSILVDRNSERSRRDSYIKMKQVLDMGLHMSIYPEGTRNKTSEPLKSFHDGAFRLSVDTRKSIIPALIFHTKKVLPPDKTFFLWPHRLEMHFLAPVPVEENMTAGQLKEKIFKMMTEYYVKN
ncbi:MAG: lysophospholipid acyltransferase family protein, partial [Chitinophagaceae bacterium]